MNEKRSNSSKERTSAEARREQLKRDRPENLRTIAGVSWSGESAGVHGLGVESDLHLGFEETPEQRWEKAGIGSDVIFCRVMQNKDLFLKLMQRIFPELRLVAIKDHTIQKTGYGPIDSKGVRFDVYSEIDGRCFDVEMQMRQEGDERKRTRYYQCMMDEQLLQTGMSYSDLPESYVVMIGTFDLFGQNRHIYRFRNYEMSDKSLLLEDGTMKVFLNSRGTENDISEELKNFLDLVNGLKPADDFCEELDHEVRKAKQSAEVRRSYMDLEDKLRHERNRALKEGIEYGRQQGLEQGQMVIARRMFEQGMAYEVVRGLVDGTISDEELHAIEEGQ